VLFDASIETVPDEFKMEMADLQGGVHLTDTFF
jgi:hypothetical protein